MIYEHTAQKKHFVIEWARADLWGENHRTKWIASCNGAFLAHGADPQEVLSALTMGLCLPTLDGSNPALIGLPPHLDGWRTGRD